ncbi:MAG: response regulator [Planctomycetota bacterium]
MAAGAPDIIVVDDDQLEHELYRQALGRIDGDLRTEFFTDSQAAAKSFAAYAEQPPENQPRLALVDLYMPGMTGPELLRTRQERWATLQTPFCIVSTSSARIDRSQCRELGCDAYFVKPSRFAELIALLREKALPLMV